MRRDAIDTAFLSLMLGESSRWQFRAIGAAVSSALDSGLYLEARWLVGGPW